MFHLIKATLLAAVLLLMLTACGDSNKSDNSMKNCVIGESEIGDCKL